MEVCTASSNYHSIIFPVYRNRVKHIIANCLAQLLRSGCLCANVMLTSIQIPSLNRRWTGHVQLRHTPTSKKCHHLSLGNDSLLLSVPSPLLLTLSDFKGNSSKHTPLYSNTWKLKHDHRSHPPFTAVTTFHYSHPQPSTYHRDKFLL